MQAFLKNIQKELNRAIRNLARQDFNSAVENIEYVNSQSPRPFGRGLSVTTR